MSKGQTIEQRKATDVRDMTLYCMANNNVDERAQKRFRREAYPKINVMQYLKKNKR